jgi:hypothetical protein
MEISRSPALAGMVRELYQAMGSGDADAVEGFYSLSPHAVFLGPTGPSSGPTRHGTTVRCGPTGSGRATG